MVKLTCAFRLGVRVGEAGALKQVERLAESLTPDERYRLLIDAVTDYAIYMLDAEGRVTSWNPGAQRFKGYTELVRGW